MEFCFHYLQVSYFHYIQGFPCLPPVLPCTGLLCRTVMSLTYRNTYATSYRLLPHCAEGGVGIFFSASFRGLLLSSTLQGGIKLHARYNLTLSPFIYSYSPDLLQILYLWYIFFFRYLLFICCSMINLEKLLSSDQSGAFPMCPVLSQSVDSEMLGLGLLIGDWPSSLNQSLF